MLFKNLMLFLMFNAIIAYSNIISISMDNDNVAKSDKHYTHGTRISYEVSATNTIFKIFNNYGTRNKKASLSIAQYMYTPTDISIKELIEDDRPYGGWLYLGMSIYSISGNICNSIEINLGIVGPCSYAEETQKYVHNLLPNSVEPQGWDNQIRGEPGINIIYQHRDKKIGHRNFDFITLMGWSIGNVHTFSNAGIIFRFGHNIPDDFGPIRFEPTARLIRPIEDFSLYGVVYSEGRLVFRNIFLDGNTFSESHSVEKIPVVGDFSFGAGTKIKNVHVIFLYNIRSKEFYKQKTHNEFGSLMATYSW